MKYFLDKHIEQETHYGRIKVYNGTLHWWLLDPKEKRNHYTEFNSHAQSGAIFQKEIYDVATMGSHRSRMQKFNLLYTYDRVAIFIEPDFSVRSNTSRSRLLMDDESSLPWNTWAYEFSKNMPDVIHEMEAELFAKSIQDLDKEYSDWMAIPRSIKTTSIKPSGTVSLLAGATPGIHFPESRHYIRRMRLGVGSTLVKPLEKAGYKIEPAFGSEDTTLVVEIPVDVGEGVRTVSEVSMWEQLSLAALAQRYWADNQVSCTVTFDPKTEGHQLTHALDIFQYQLKGVSFLPKLEMGAYPQMPYESIDEATYHEMKDSLGNLIIKNRRMTGVTDKQIKELGIDFTPQHPEKELTKAGVIFESKTALRDVFANLTVTDDESKFVTGQNQNAGHETPQKMMEILKNKQ